MLRLIQHHVRELAHKVTRPAAVTEAQRAHVRSNPRCAACLGTEHCQGHHISPYHKDPDHAADPANFITLCMGPDECHIRIGHGDSFRSYNPNVVRDAAAYLTATPTNRLGIQAEARAARLPDEP